MSHDEYRERRERVLEAIDPGVLILFSTPVALRNNDVEHEYRQDSDLYYLTGFDEPESALVLSTLGEARFTMFVRPRNPERETWDGPMAGVEGAVQRFFADRALAIEELSQQLVKMLRGAPRLFYQLGQSAEHDAQVLGAIDRLRSRSRDPVVWPTSIHEPGSILHPLRLRKSEREIDLMRQAVAITEQGHRAAMSSTRPGMYEYEIEGLLRQIFRAGGSERPAYSPIVGSGPNATILHHRRNDRRIQDGDLVLIDAGCELGYYASDVTRTYPANGRFSSSQREIYEIVLAAQEAAIARAVMGSTLDAVHQAALSVVAEGLIRLGLVEGPPEVALSEKRYRPFFMHRTSHWLGMDVHDVGAYFVDGAARPLEPGMVLTVEPGIYVSEGAPVDPRYRGIGVRIEDDVVVSEQGPVVLSASIPRACQEVERACAR